MRIIIVGGKNEADYLIGLFLKEKNEVLVINDDEHAAAYIADHHRIPVLVGDPTKSYIYEDAKAYDYDVIVALSENDIDNFITCLTAKKLFNVKKTIARVLNPKRVEIFKNLGLDTTISSIYMLGQMIKEEANIKAVFKTLTMEDDKIAITEVEVKETYRIHNQQIMYLNLPPRINIACILRGKRTIIPNGQTTIQLGDKLVIVSATEDQKHIYTFLNEKVS